ncbi:hypothetical protein J4461_03005 [Candidatus Pacearchaeota archaeon]|nr:hypothetical protein [Candidatus Pacearchaeota archaeon]
MIVKLLGALDIASALAFMMFIFGMQPPLSYLIFCITLLFIKGLFIFGGDVLSVLDICSAIILALSIFFALPVILWWAPSFLLLAKGVWSFL